MGIHNIFDKCGNCGFFKATKLKDGEEAIRGLTWDGKCVNKHFRKHFFRNADSESCPHGKPRDDYIAPVMPEKPRNEGG